MTVAPLRIIKKHTSRASPPQLPQPIHEMLQDLSLSTQKTDANTSHELTYRRVIYAFSIEQSDAMYLKLEPDQIIHVHLQHFSGWTDGTLISTSSRGWFPLEYTEPYILMAVRPVIAASQGLYALFSSCKHEEYIIGITSLMSSVRELLIRTNSLEYNAMVVKNNSAIRQKRKILLNELNKLADIAKNASEQPSLYSENKDLSNELIFRLDHIVLLSKQFAHMIGPEKEACDEPLLSPIPSFSNEFLEHIYAHHKIASTISPSFVSLNKQTNKIYNEELNSQLSKTSLHSQTYYNPTSAFQNLTVANDNFLSHLASFIGRLHLHSHTPNQLLLATKQCVYTARELLSVIEPISIKHPDTQLYIAKEDFYTKITSFVAVVKKVITAHCSTSNNKSEESIIDKSECKRLIDAAANSVRGASQCIAKAKFILETIGDFNISTLLFKQKNYHQLTPAYGHISKNLQTTIENISFQETQKSHVFPISQTPKPISNIFTKEKKETENKHLISHSKNISQESINNESNDSHLISNTDMNIKPLSNKSLEENSESSHVLFIKPHSVLSHISPLSASESSEKTVPDSKLKVHDLPSGTASSFASSERFSITSSYAEHVSSPATSPEPFELDSAFGNKEKNNAKHILLNHEGQVIGATLYSLIEKMTMHDTTPDAIFASTFYLTFRLFTTPRDLALGLLERFPTEKPIDADHNWDHYYAMPIRLRVYNVFKTWIDNYWHKSSDEEALNIIKDFAYQLRKYLPQVSTRFEELVNKISSKTISNTCSTNTSKKIYNLSNKSVYSDIFIPPVIISKNLRTQLRTASFEDNPDSFNIMDFDPLEIARQLTLKESKLFCSILPEELVRLGTSQKTNTSTTVKAMAALSTDITGWVAESILSQNDIKKRTAVMKQWIKIGNKCLELNNYNTLMAIVSGLNSSTISRLKKTWNTLSTKSKNIFDNLRSITDCSRNYAIYRSRLKENLPPCLPFLGLILTDITFIEEGNPSYRSFRNSSSITHSIQLINYDKYIKIYSIISKLQQFQEPYKLELVEELQTWIESQVSRIRMKGQNNLTELWRRSLALEPKTQSQSSQENDQMKNANSSIFTVTEITEDSDAKRHCYNNMDSLINWTINPIVS
ncbi:uncharacterized protein T551_00170 [Pneumocystis jirovecii RU7]|uniref:Ras-GEF domain-containing protein n=1 Tax=Pneumocystis jirovecii (strain RU7) TaxID=1408657 RepID=A0A0W4ZWD7_PNEJ7|nr:uncharacterized protein T551_00170 [Pneumocystis jirovecii RU7]KTW32685.1 hypothetical protein T551_00170 [Pneumocystis jirovecii RU7]